VCVSQQDWPPCIDGIPFVGKEAQLITFTSNYGLGMWSLEGQISFSFCSIKLYD